MEATLLLRFVQKKRERYIILLAYHLISMLDNKDY